VAAGTYHVAIDLGAGSGRAMLGRLDPYGLHLEEVHRFHYAPLLHDGHMRWSFAAILAGLKDGIRAAQRAAEDRGDRLETVGVDSWGVDYGLLDGAGRLLEDPVCYRDHRTDGAIERVLSKVPRAEIFDRTGIQFLQFNTIFQLHEHVREGLPAGARRLLMIPDLCHHALCGSTTGEYTNASTTQLVDVRTRDWADDLFTRLGLPRELMPEILAPGTALGELTPSLRKELDLQPLGVVAPATHDTGSAVAGIPLDPGWVYISSGTWSLVGVERPTPLLGAPASRANFTNEGGVFGTIRFLKNVMGLWILDSCRREWAGKGLAADLETLLQQAAAIEPSPGFVFPDHPRFFNPERMTTQVQGALAETGQRATEDPARLTRVILDSLAFRYASVVSTIELLTAETVRGIHIAGGGCLNDYVNQATADAAGKPVLAGPAEATACGNVLMQAVASGRLASLAEGRRIVREAVRPRLFEPRAGSFSVGTRDRYREIEGRHTEPG
jgi:rhamnulokinase